MVVRARPGESKPLAADRGCLVLADISGYTDYVVASPLEYAEDVLADVTGVVSEHLGAALRLNKLEGDAVFGYALEGRLDASILLDAIEQCYTAFHDRLEGISHATSCGCNACVKLPDLGLKFVVHYGTFIRRAGGPGEELTGHDVIVAHRLLKNSVTDELGHGAYALFTAASVEALSIDATALGMREYREAFAGVGEIESFVLDLEVRRLEEKERRRIVVAPAEAAFEVETFLPVSPPVAWDYLTAPENRSVWQSGRVKESSPGGRRGPGTESYCVDGRATVYEEILDWRPFDYYTERRSVGGATTILLTTELEETAGGTVVKTRAGRLPGRGRVAWPVTRARLLRGLRRDYRRLTSMVLPEE